MENDLKNKIVAITGGANGIGYQITEEYLKEGVKVAIILDINDKEGENAVQKLNAKYGKNKTIFYKCDVTKDLKQTVNKLSKDFKNIDVLVNNAGILSENNIKKTIDVNVTSLIEWTSEFMGLMRTDKGGKGGTIINVASICGFRAFPYFPVYQASKFAVLGFTRCLGHEYNFKRTGVRVLAVCPGFTKTELGASIKSNESESQVVRDMEKFLEDQIWQEAQAVGRATVDVFLSGTPGSAWLIEGGKPIEEV